MEKSSFRDSGRLFCAEKIIGLCYIYRQPVKFHAFRPETCKKTAKFSQKSGEKRSGNTFIHICTARGRLCQSTFQSLVVHEKTDNAPCILSGTTTVFPQVLYKKNVGQSSTGQSGFRGTGKPLFRRQAPTTSFFIAS